jgi:hypothetical protein
MDFRIISPTAGLEKFATLSKSHLILAHVKDSSYRSFYKERREAGDHLILDNGAHEKGKSIDWSQLYEAIDFYNPQVVVLPDTLNDPIKTASESLRFLDTASMIHTKVEWMYVVQAKDGFADLERVNNVLKDTRVGHLIKWLGITRYLTIDNGLSRSVIRKLLAGYQRKFHALGLVNGSIKELQDLEGFDSVDSSVPVWRGWNAFSVTTDAKWPEIPVDFSTTEEPFSEKLIYNNLQICLEAANADTTELERRLSRS